MAEYGTKEYYKENIASAKLNKIIYIKALREVLNSGSSIANLEDEIIVKISNEISNIKYYEKCVKDLEESEGK